MHYAVYGYFGKQHRHRMQHFSKIYTAYYNENNTLLKVEKNLICDPLSPKMDERIIIVSNVSENVSVWNGYILFNIFKETRSVTMNIFRKKNFLFKSFVKIELSYVFTINMFSTSWKLQGKVNYLMKKCVFFLIGNYLRPSNNSRQLIFNINAVVLIVVIC